MNSKAQITNNLDIMSNQNFRLVLRDQLHKYQKENLMQGGVNLKQRKNTDQCENYSSSEPVKYDMQIKHGKTNICIVSPPPMSQEEAERVLDDYYSAAWSIIESLSERKSG